MKKIRSKSLLTKLKWMSCILLLFNVVFLVIINKSSINNLKTHVVDINTQTLENITENWSEIIGNAGTYIMNISYHEREVLKPLMTGDDKEKIDYILASNEIRKRFLDDLRYRGGMSAYFVYIGQNDDLIIANADDKNKYAEYEDEIKKYCVDVSSWRQMKENDGYHLIKAINIGYSTYMGAILDIDDIVRQLRGMYPNTELKFQIFDDDIILYDDLNSTDKIGAISIEKEIQSVAIKIKEIIPVSWLYKQIPYKHLFMLICISVCMIILMIVFYIVQYNAIQKPIDSLVKSVKKVESGIMDARVEEQGSYEFDYLIKSYNDMLDKIYDLKIDIAETQLKKKYAKLKQLQAQINPHFFMNSLNLISSLSALQDYETTSKLVCYLSDYFRFAVQNTEIFTTVEREVEHIKTCLEIHKIRFPENLDYECIVPDEVKNYPIPPLTIQPITENAIIHGQQNERNKIFRVTVKVTKKNGYLFIVVSDNGRGFTEERINYIKNGLGDSRETEHIGIKNVYLRLNMFFDGGVDMDFKNNDVGGAEITIKLPEKKLLEAGKNV